MPVLTSLTDTETALLLIPEDEIVLSIAAASVFVWIAVNEISANKTVNIFSYNFYLIGFFNIFYTGASIPKFIHFIEV